MKGRLLAGSMEPSIPARLGDAAPVSIGLSLYPPAADLQVPVGLPRRCRRRRLRRSPSRLHFSLCCLALPFLGRSGGLPSTAPWFPDLELDPVFRTSALGSSRPQDRPVRARPLPRPLSPLILPLPFASPSPLRDRGFRSFVPPVLAPARALRLNLPQQSQP